MPDLRIATNDLTNKLNSDREVLPFPQGGVFGDTPSTAPNRTVLEIGKTLDTMQQQLNELSEAVDDVLKFSDFTDPIDGGHIPPSAA